MECMCHYIKTGTKSIMIFCLLVFLLHGFKKKDNHHNITFGTFGVSRERLKYAKIGISKVMDEWKMKFGVV